MKPPTCLTPSKLLRTLHWQLPMWLMSFSLAAHAVESKNYDAEIETLLSKMSLEEKVGQMVQIDLGVVMVPNKTPIQLDSARLREALLNYQVGSILNNGPGHALSLDEWHYVIKTIQDIAARETPNKIPVLYGIDSIHGASYTLGSTLFPQNIAMAATRNPELVRRAAEVSARETRASGIRWTFAPVLDVGTSRAMGALAGNLWGGSAAGGRAGAATIRGFEGDDVGSPNHVAACMKHYLGYSYPFNGKDRSPALIPDPELREFFLPPFMRPCAPGEDRHGQLGRSERRPAHASKYLLTDLLRGELGFDGIVVSDWEDVIRLHTWHAVADSPKRPSDWPSRRGWT